MDIQYLLLLQHLREATGGAFDELLNGISKVTISVLVFLPFVIYWAHDKKWGSIFFAAYYITDIVNLVVKLTACVYRPWIRAPEIQPAGDSKLSAGGYSFPSGHAECAASILGPAAVWQWKKRNWIFILCAVGMLLVCVSRNFLGVHMPQDVVVGLAEGLAITFLVAKIYPAVSKSERSADILCFAGIFLSAAFLAYIQLKPYPMDYVDGKLLVDPKDMTADGFRGCGGFLAFCVANYLDRHFIHYEIPYGSKNLPLLAAIGTGILFSLKSYFIKALAIVPFGEHWGTFVGYFVLAFFGIAIWPIVIMKCAQEE